MANKKTSINAGIFKTYDIRGRYPEEINETVIYKIGWSLAGFFKKGRIIVGYDARLSSPRLYKKAMSGLNKNKNLQVIGAGLMTTPMLYFLVSYLDARGGLIITASHNPKEYNGLKVVKRGAVPMSGIEIRKIMRIH